MKPLTFKTFIKDVLLQSVFFLLLALLFYFMQTGRSPFDISILYGLLKASPIMLFGLTYCILFYYLFFKKVIVYRQLIKSLLILLMLIAGYFAGDVMLTNLLMYVQSGSWHIVGFEVPAIYRFILFTAYAIPYSFIKGFVWMREQKLMSEKAQINASLQNLRARIEPHFIFNSLNNLYGLAIEEKAAKTSDSIIELSALFRYTLKESNVEKISVQQELDFIEKYIHLHRLRISEGEKMKLIVTILWDKKPAEIAPLLLINFVENAFKYGISLQEYSFIKIDISVEDGRLRLVVQNTMHKNNTLKNGYGLINSRKRLDLLYKNKYTLEEKDEETMHEAVLTINLH